MPPKLLHMNTTISERAFEDAIEATLLQSSVGDDWGRNPGGYCRRQPGDYDRELCFLGNDVLSFVQATQPREWEKLSQRYGVDAEEQFLGRLSSETKSRGALSVLRHGVKDMGCEFQLAYFRPASGLNEETQRRYQANIFSVVRQLRYSVRSENSLDVVLFLNGLPIFTAELKNPLTGQTVLDAVRQYRKDRDPRELLFAGGRCLAHFAVDPDMVYVTTRLDKDRTRFLPFNQGKFGGAGNPPIPPTQTGYATAYLWEETWARDSVLDLIQRFVHEVKGASGHGRNNGKRQLIFPRYQQLDCVRRLVRDAYQKGAGQHYLIKHSAGSGKSFTIAWLAHQLSTLHGADDRRIFDSIIVVTDRRILDRQLQENIRQFEQTLGVVENINTTSRQLKDALEAGKTIIVTTLQKFPVIASQIGDLPGRKFALIIDEAHSSQSGESSKSLKATLSVSSLDDAEEKEAQLETPEEEIESTILEEIRNRGRQPNLSTFAFTATPKSKTLELFGNKRPDGQFEPFHTYTMRQAIEEGFILDVLTNYTTCKAYWKLWKTVEGDPHYDKRKATYLLKSYVELNPHAIDTKVRIMVEHFIGRVQGKIGNQAKAMIVTRSRLHAVRYKLAMDHCLAEQGHPFKALVAFSGKVEGAGQSYTESGMNGLSEAQTASAFAEPEYRFLIVANKFQTGFDQPLLHTMYVDKKLSGVNAVQTLSRLNRTHPNKSDTLVLDFANETDEIKTAFDPHYETTLLSEATDPNLLYQVQTRLHDYPVYAKADIDGFTEIYFRAKVDQSQLYAALSSSVERFCALSEDERNRFRKELTGYVRLYAFLAQVLTFADPDLEKLYVFARHLRRLLPPDPDEQPFDVRDKIDMESYRVVETGSGSIELERGAGRLDSISEKEPYGPLPEDVEVLSRIIFELNERFGTELGSEHSATLGQMMEKLEEDATLDASARVNTRENVRLAFDHKVDKVIQEIVDTNFDLYKRITDDQDFGEAVKNYLFDQYLRSRRSAEELIEQGESKTLEFKSTLRWSLKEDRKNDKGVTHAALKTIAAFLNTEGGDLLIGVADDGSIVGIEKDRLENNDKFMRHLMQVVESGLGRRARTRIDPRMQAIDGKNVCMVSCRRSPEPVYLAWKGLEAVKDGDFFVRNGPTTVKLSLEDSREYIRQRFS